MCPKLSFRRFFFFHRITVKPSPRQLDQGALLANFLHKRTLCSVHVCAIFFFYLPRRRFKPFFGSTAFFSVFVFLNVNEFFFFFNYFSGRREVERHFVKLFFLLFLLYVSLI